MVVGTEPASHHILGSPSILPSHLTSCLNILNFSSTLLPTVVNTEDRSLQSVFSYLYGPRWNYVCGFKLD